MHKKNFTILTEASGSITSGYLIKNIQTAGHICIASDINHSCFGKYLADDFVLFPKCDNPNLWKSVESALLEKKIDYVIPSLDETLLGWSKRKAFFEKHGIKVVVSNKETIETCQDKWETYKFFKRYDIPTFDTSLEKLYPLVKPRFGRGSLGVTVTDEKINMDGLISQELGYGIEYTIDVLCDMNSNPIYIVPRRRINVLQGKSTGGLVEFVESIINWVKLICCQLSFVGPINIQCFVLPDKSVKFIEINPRIAGGMALSFASTENWIPLIIKIMNGETNFNQSPVKYGLRMLRFYDEIFI